MIDYRDRARPPGVAEVFEELHERTWTSLAEAQEFLNARMERYNTTPQADLGGFSPDQVQALIYGDWKTAGPLRMNPAVSSEDLTGSEFYRVSRALLYRVRQDPVKLTEAGYLPRTLLRELAEGEVLRNPRLRDLLRSTRRISEGDLLPVHLPRVTLEIAGLVRKRKARLVLRRSGRTLLEPAAAGQLFVLLFETFFRKLNLAYAGRFGPDLPEFQHLVGYAIARLRSVAQDWVADQGVRQEAIHPGIRLEPSPSLPDYDPLVALTAARLLHPLVQFGLLEERYLPDRDSWPHEWQLRKTPLFDRFLPD